MFSWCSFESVNECPEFRSVYSVGFGVVNDIMPVYVVVLLEAV